MNTLIRVQSSPTAPTTIGIILKGTHVTPTPKSGQPVTTRDLWIPFQLYHIDRRGECNVPKQYLKGAFWQTEQGDPGYVVSYTCKDGTTGLIPVEFNFEHTCWTKLKWDALHYKLQVVRPAGSSLHLDILQSEVTTRDQWGPIDGEEEEPVRSPTPETPAPSPSLTSNPKEIRILEAQAEQEETQLGLLAESIPTDMTTTITKQPTTFQEPTRISRREGPPGGGGGEGGDGGGGGDPGGPLFAGPNVSSRTKPERFMGKEPLIFMGDCTRVQQFLTQWELFVETNYDNPAFTLPYCKALIFLTYIQGDHVNEWVLSTTKWVKAYKAKHGPYNKWIWEAIELGFRNTFTDTLERECAQQDLQKGFRMEGQDIDSYIAKFEKADQTTQTPQKDLRHHQEDSPEDSQDKDQREEDSRAEEDRQEEDRQEEDHWVKEHHEEDTGQTDYQVNLRPFSTEIALNTRPFSHNGTYTGG
ncbi:hypothetical protein EDB87DRAFT_1690387 [Lactarius vividus]|nr:hypothetical protein EDB87DRAFT_1690387 [Lactarius vividus]